MKCYFKYELGFHTKTLLGLCIEGHRIGRPGETRFMTQSNLKLNRVIEMQKNEK